MEMMVPLFVGAPAAAGTAATAGLIGAGGAVTLGGALSAAGTVLSLMGASSQADNMRRAAAANAENARRTAEINKQQTDYAAGQAEAAGQHQAEQDRHKAMLMLSRAQAVAAASGGGPLDATLASGILGKGEEQAGYSMYEANDRAKGLRYRGDVGAYEANARGISEINQANKAANATVMGSFAKAGLSMAERFMPSAAPGDVMTVGDTTYYGGAGPDRNWGYGD